jgi:hypothetical protein
MKTLWVIAVSLMLGSASCVMEEVAEESAAVLGDVTQELDTEQETDDGQVLAAGTYRFVSRESCADVFGQACTGSVPANQCPGAQPGLACSTAPSSCWKVINSSTVDSYRCL